MPVQTCGGGLFPLKKLTLMTSLNTPDTGERVSTFVSTLAYFEGLKFRITLYYRVEMKMERVMGIEPTSRAWEAHVLPLYDTRVLGWASLAEPLGLRKGAKGRFVLTLCGTLGQCALLSAKF